MAVRISRDPIEEDGGYNLYAMVYNDPVGAWDYLGLEERDLTPIEKQHVQASINDLRKNGEAKVADRLQKMLNDKKIKVDTELKSGAETKLDKHINLSERKADPYRVSRKVKGFEKLAKKDPTVPKAGIISTSGTLRHEDLHANKQTNASIIMSNARGLLTGKYPHEIEAYTAQIKYLEKVLKKTTNENLKGEIQDMINQAKEQLKKHGGCKCE